MKIYIEKYGCKRRYAELTSLHNYFVLNGFKIVKSPAKADYILLSTCAFRKQEEDYSISRLRVLKNYKAKLIVYGCLPDISPTRFKEFTNTTYFTPKDIHKIDSYFCNLAFKFSEFNYSNLISEQTEIISIPAAINKLKNEFEFSDIFFLRMSRYAEKKVRKILNLKNKEFCLYICKGCQGNCSYCAIKRAIGTIKSLPVEVIIKQFKKGVSDGYKKFVILGDDVGAYGRDWNSTFPELLSILIDESDYLFKDKSLRLKLKDGIRFSIEEIHPKWIILYQEKLFNIVYTNKIKSILCPIQSGSNRILRLMNREHTIENISLVLSKLRSINPEIKLSTQIIAGFPSETEEEFTETLYICQKLKFNSVTIFPYHEKENTPAAKLTPKIPEHVIKERIRIGYKFLNDYKIKVNLSCN